MSKESALTEKQKRWAYEKWCLGYTQEQIASALYVSVKTVRRAFQGKKRERPHLIYDDNQAT